MKNAPHYAIASVDHALQLATLLQVEGPVGVSQAADRIGVARSTAHRLLQMLVYRDFAVQVADRRYAAGPVLSPGALPEVADSVAVRSASLPHLSGLVLRVDETASVVILAGAHVRFLATVECGQRLRVGDRAGTVFPAHLTSGGVALLAALPDDDIEQRFDGAAVDLRLLRKEVDGVRRMGFALNRDRTEAGVTAVGRAIRGEDGAAVAAISLSMPSVRFREVDLPRYAAELALCCRDIERDLAALPH